MIALLFFAILGIASVYVFYSGKNVLGLILLIGFTQDSVRKLTPGEPIIFIVTVGVLFGAVLLGIWLREGFYRSFEPFTKWSKKITEPLLLFLIILFLQLIYSLAVYGNVIIGFLGLTTYLAPFLAVIVGYYLVNSIDDIRQFIKAYVIVGLIVAASVVISFAGFQNVILNEVGAGLKIYDMGTVLKSHAGIMRTGEVAAWHISTTACMIVTLALTTKKTRSVALITLIVGLLMVAVTLTGRRKMLMLATVFLLAYFIALLYYRKTLSATYFINILIFVIAVWIGFEIINFDDYNNSLRNYIARGSTVFYDASGRFVELGINPIQWAYNRVGLFGGGLGIASQGSHLFSAINVAGGSAEGGLGKIMVELGLPGLICVIWLVITLASHVDRSLQLSLQASIDWRLLPLMLSLSVLIAANALTFSVATQVYGDIFILILLGLFGGFIFALPKIALNSMQRDPNSRFATA